MKSRRKFILATGTIRSMRRRAATACAVALHGATSARLPSLPIFAALVLLLCLRPGLGEDTPAVVSAPGSVTATVLEAKLTEVEAAAELQDDAKADLLSLYRQALSNVQAAISSRETAQVFEQARQTAPAETQAIREEMDKSQAVAPEDTLEANPSTPLPEIELLLEKEKADLAAVDARSSDFGKRLEEEAGRPALIRQRLTQAKDQQSEVAAQLKLPSPADEGPTKAEARRWVLETGYEALSAEIQMLDQELLSQPARVELLKARRDKAAASVVWVGKRVKMLEDLANQSRQAEAETAKTTAAATRREAEGKHPLVVQLAEQNAELTEEVAERASELADLAVQTENADRLARQLDADFKSANESISIGIYGLNEDLGYVMQQQRESLPDLRSFRRQARERDEKAGRTAARRLIHQRELTQLGDPANYVAGIISEARPDETPEMRERLLVLATERKALLAKAVESDDVYLRKLGELESAQRRLLELIERFDAFLDVHLLWVRSASPSQLQELAALPADVWRMLSPEGWSGVARALLSQASRSPVFVLISIALGLLLWSRKHLIGFIQDISSKLGKPTTDRFSFSVQTLAITLLVAAPWPLLMAVAGWQLKVSVEATDFSDAAGGALLVLAAQLYYLLSFRLVCMPHGLAAAHLRWPNSDRAQATPRVAPANLGRHSGDRRGPLRRLPRSAQRRLVGRARRLHRAGCLACLRGLPSAASRFGRAVELSPSQGAADALAPASGFLSIAGRCPAGARRAGRAGVPVHGRRPAPKPRGNDLDADRPGRARRAREALVAGHPPTTALRGSIGKTTRIPGSQARARPS
jgi:potassium efflux system protein